MYDTIRQLVEEDKKNLHFFASFLIAQVSLYHNSSEFERVQGPTFTGSVYLLSVFDVSVGYGATTDDD